MKKLLILILATSLLLASCGGKENNENNESTNDTTVTTPDNGTSDEVVDDGAAEEDTSADVTVEIPEGGVSSVTTTEEAALFIDVNVYSQCMEVLPMSTMSMPLAMEDIDSITYHTGLTDLTGINEIIISESMIGSFAYSLVMVRTDGTNTDEIQTALGEQINPRKWLCVGADQIRTVRLDNDIILVMSDNGRTEPVMNAVVAAASAVYENVGTVVNVLG